MPLEDTQSFNPFCNSRSHQVLPQVVSVLHWKHAKASCAPQARGTKVRDVRPKDALQELLLPGAAYTTDPIFKSQALGLTGVPQAAHNIQELLIYAPSESEGFSWPLTAHVQKQGRHQEKHTPLRKWECLLDKQLQSLWPASLQLPLEGTSSGHCSLVVTGGNWFLTMASSTSESSHIHQRRWSKISDTPTRMATIQKKKKNNKCWRGYGKIRTHVHVARGNVNQCSREAVEQFLTKLCREITVRSSDPTPADTPKEWKAGTNTDPPISTAALFAVAERCKQPWWPSTDEQVSKMRFLQSTKHCSSIKRNETLIPATSWMNRENTVLHKLNQTQKDKHCLTCVRCRDRQMQRVRKQKRSYQRLGELVFSG